MSEFYDDKTLTCRDCRQAFTFTGGEQRFYTERQFAEPTRCKPCRAAKKASREAQTPEAPAPAQLDTSNPRRPFTYEPSSDLPKGGGGKRKAGEGKRKRDETSGWKADYDD